MPTIVAVTVTDVRFPTSLTMDGSDAMNKDGDYSAAYVHIRTDDARCPASASPSRSAVATTSAWKRRASGLSRSSDATSPP